jgi:hypothetical protein
MSENLENTESAAENERRKASTEPSLAGESGQYVEGDYGDAGVVGPEVEETIEGEYPEGDYGDAGTAGTAREAETDEEKNS